MELRKRRGVIKSVYRTKTPRGMEVLECGFEDTIAVLELPERYRRRLRTTNGI